MLLALVFEILLMEEFLEIADKTLINNSIDAFLFRSGDKSMQMINFGLSTWILITGQIKINV